MKDKAKPYLYINQNHRPTPVPSTVRLLESSGVDRVWQSSIVLFTQQMRT